jgi:hypothetical protein
VTYSKCSGTAASCITIGSTVSLDADLSSSGALTASEIDVLDAVAGDEVEGTIYPTGVAGVVGLVIQGSLAEYSETLCSSLQIPGD